MKRKNKKEKTQKKSERNQSKQGYKIRCKDCIFISTSKYKRVVCRRYPPTVHTQESGSSDFPTVDSEHDYCGEFANNIKSTYDGVLSFEIVEDFISKKS